MRPGPESAATTGAMYETLAAEGAALAWPPALTTKTRPAPTPGAAVHASWRWPGASTAQPEAVLNQAIDQALAQRTQALADGILDAAILVFYERQFRPAELHWDAWLAGQTQKALQGLDALEAQAAGFSAAPDVGQIAAACALGWLEFRAPFGDVRAGRPALTAWFERFSSRPSMAATAPHA